MIHVVLREVENVRMNTKIIMGIVQMVLLLCVKTNGVMIEAMKDKFVCKMKKSEM